METQSEQKAIDGYVSLGGEEYMRDAKGALIPIALVKEQHKLEDQMVRKIASYADDLSKQIARFKGHTFEDLSAFNELLAEKYGAARGGRKGNCTFHTVDRLFKVTVQMADQIDFGPELQVAKTLIDECLSEWTEEGRDEIKIIVLKAFNVENTGQINKAELFMLLRLEIEDARWKRAMDAIRDAIRIVGSKMYFRFHRRADPNGAWVPITIDLAKA